MVGDEGELQRLLSLIGYGSTGGVCGRSLTEGKILFTGRQTCSLYFVLGLCGRGNSPGIAASLIFFFFAYGSTGGVSGWSLTAGKILFTGKQTCSHYFVIWLCDLYVTLFQWYLWVKSKYHYIPRFYRSLLEHLFSYYYTIFKLILLQYNTFLSNNFCGIVDQCGQHSLILKLNCRHLWQHGYTTMYFMAS